MSNYTKDQNKITIYYDGHDYLDVPSLCLRAVRSLVNNGYDDCVFEYDETIVIYAKKNKSGITVRQLKAEA